jgi:hypothetical protein
MARSRVAVDRFEHGHHLADAEDDGQPATAPGRDERRRRIGVEPALRLEKAEERTQRREQPRPAGGRQVGGRPHQEAPQVVVVQARGRQSFGLGPGAQTRQVVTGGLEAGQGQALVGAAMGEKIVTGLVPWRLVHEDAVRFGSWRVSAAVPLCPGAARRSSTKRHRTRTSRVVAVAPAATSRAR